MVRDALRQLVSEAEVDALLRWSLAQQGDEEVPRDAVRLTLFVCGPLHEALHVGYGSEVAFAFVREMRSVLDLAIDIERASGPERAPSSGMRPGPGWERARSGVIRPARTGSAASEPSSRTSRSSRLPPELEGRADPGSRPDTIPYLGTPSPKGDVVVVEPHDGRRREVSVALGREGYDVIGAADGASALLLSQRLRPSVLVVAEDIPEIDGVTLAHVLHESDRILATPVVIRTDGDTARPLPPRARWSGTERGLISLVALVDEVARRPLAP